MRVLVFVLGFLAVPLAALAFGGMIWLCANFAVPTAIVTGLVTCVVVGCVFVSSYDHAQKGKHRRSREAHDA